MAGNTGRRHRAGYQRERSQVQTANGRWVKFNDKTGRIVSNGKKRFKGVRRRKLG